MSDTQTPDEPEFVDPDDLKVSRDSKGELIGEVHECGDWGDVEIVPMTYGDVQERFGDGMSSDLEAGEMAMLFNEFYVNPSFDLDAEGVRDFKPMVPADLLMTLMDASGIDADIEVDDDGSATVEVGNT